MNLNKTVFMALLLFAIAKTTAGQYYYQDVYTTMILNKEYRVLQTAGYKMVKISSFEENDEPSEGFFCEKKFNARYTESEMLSRSYITGGSVLKSYYDQQNGIVKTVNTTASSINTTLYQYSEDGNIASITTISTSADGKDSIAEAREYTYADHQPVKMVRKKNGATVAVFDFVIDEKGNVIEEKPVQGQGITYYYYYDDQNRLTDVVRFNEIARKLLPDYMFQYAKGERPSQMISIDETARNYFIWRYAYDKNGLPEIEKCYSKEKRLLGTIQYDYK